MTAKASVFSLYFAVSVLAIASFAVPNARAATLTDAKISEFVADNSDGIVDEDDDREDWIEIWNTSGVAGDLGGWYLTDDPANPTKWELPAIEMTSGGYLVVFASGKDRATAAGEPHTNFGLQREAGGYLALVKPDGVTIASEFANYPEQSKDIAYGVGIEGETPVTFFSAGAPAKWHVPAGPVAEWTETDFDDSAWNAGATGIGYDGPGGDYLALLGEGGNVRSEMLSQNATVYIRIPFEVTDPTGISNLSLRLKWEDGFVAHLNGTEFHKESAPANPAWNSSATDGSRNETNAKTFFEYAVDEGGLVAGTNVLTIQGLNTSTGSSDVLFVPEFTGIFQDTNNLVAGFFSDPTPGEENSIRYDGITGDTSFSVDRGVYDTAFDLAITTSTEGAEIRYTTDGTPPSETSGLIYSGPISITGTTVVRAIAHKSGFKSTNIDTQSYIFPEDVYGPQFSDSLTAVPTISLVTQNASFLNPNAGNDYGEYKSSIEMIFADGTPGFQEDAGMTNFGGRFTRFDKKSFRLYFRKEYGAGKLKYPIFDGFEYKNFPPAEEFDAINLRSGSHDMTNRGAYMASRFVDDSMLEMGQIAPHGRFVHVYLNGQYWGQYHLRERWNADMASSYFGGSKEDYDAISANNSGMNFEQGTPYDGTGAFWTETRNLINGPDPFVNAAEHIDISNLIDFMLLWTSGECESEFRAFGSKSRGVPFKFMVRDPDGFMPGGGWGHVHPVTHNGPINAMRELRTGGNPDYDILLADRIHKHFFNDGALTAEESVERLRKRFEEMRSGFEAEARRWNYQTVSSWESYVNRWLNTGLPQRTTSMIQRLRQAGMYPDIIAPSLSQHGGSIPAGGGVTMTTNTTAIYYTTDGSDPRLPGGAVSPTAIDSPFSNDVRDPEDFIEAGADWKYLDDGSDQGSNWRNAGFEDASWETGMAQLGYGEAGIQTTVGFIDTNPVTGGIQKNATTYFRKNVAIESPSDFSNFVVRIRYDDGAAVYVNGVEVARTANLAANASYDTFASSPTPSESAYEDFIVPSSRFVDGVNTIAVEVHNQSARSSDMRFDLVLRGEIDLSNGNNLTEPVMFDGPTVFNARSYDSSSNEWSALTSTFFTLDTVPADATNLVISEIHYRPANPTLAEEIAVSTDRDDYEFIELLNATNQPIDLSGVYFDEGIGFHFAENTVIEGGGRIVLVKDLAAFTARYGALGEGMIAGEYSGRLSNDGEQIILRRTGGIVIADLTYNDQDPWPAFTDGAGYSMIFTGTDPTMGDNWSTNALNGGAPGEADNPLVFGYDQWKLANGITDDQSDDDHDGMTAFAEFATGNDPAIPNHGSVSTGGLVKIDTAGFLSITYQRSLSAADVAFKVQESSDLQSWADVPNPVLVNETTNEEKQTKRVTERLPDPVTPGSRKFLRVRMVR
jgi:hypothetical protein